MDENEKRLRDHYKHMCNTGFDPLICVHLEYWPVVDYKKIGETVIPIFNQEDIKHYRHIYYHIDQVITEDRYVEAMQKTGSTFTEDSEVDKLEVQNVWVPSQDANKEHAGIFWLKPNSKCRTLDDLYKTYEAKIKILFGSFK